MENLSELDMELKELEPKVREKAMEIARILMMKKKYAEKEAIREGIKQAKSWFMDLEG